MEGNNTQNNNALNNNNNENEQKMQIDNYNTPGNDPELVNYYIKLENENNQSQNNIKQSFLSKLSFCSEISNDLDLRSSFSFSKYNKAPNVILESEGNSTYMKSIIQLLANVKHMSSYYLAEINKFKYHIKETPISYYFSRIIFHFFPYPENSLQKSFSLSTFQKIIKYYNMRFDSTSEKNPIEFLNYILNILHGEDKRKRNNFNQIEDVVQNSNKKFKEYIQFLKNNEKSCILENFCWINQEIKKCLTCNVEFIEYNKKFIYIINCEEILKKALLNCNNKISIFNCIKYQTQKQKKKDNCKNCSKQSNFEVESLISISPQYLILYLELNDNKSNFGKIEINKELLLYNIVKQEYSFNKYTLNGMIVKDLSNDKYFAHCCSPIRDKWYNYKEDSICEIKNENLFELGSNIVPIILIYKAN